LVPVLVLGALCWYLSGNAVVGVATASAQSAVSQTEKYVDRVTARLSSLASLQGKDCLPEVVAVLDNAVGDIRVVRDIGLYDGHLHLGCTSRGPRDADLTDVEQARSMPFGIDVFIGPSPLSAVPALIVDLA
jgi:hypothetical protein